MIFLRNNSCNLNSKDKSHPTTSEKWLSKTWPTDGV